MHYITSYHIYVISLYYFIIKYDLILILFSLFLDNNEYYCSIMTEKEFLKPGKLLHDQMYKNVFSISIKFFVTMYRSHSSLTSNF